MKNLGKFYNLTNRGQATSAGTTTGLVNSPNEYQTAVVYDVLSEGPIEGLVNGTDSIYLNQTPATIGLNGTKFNEKSSNDVSFTASTNTIVDNNGTLFTDLATTDGTRTIRIVGAKRAATGTISITAGSTTVTSSSNFFAGGDALKVGVTSEFTNGQYINIEGAGVGGGMLTARILQYISQTSVRIDIPASNTVSNANATIDLTAKINSITNNSTAVIATLSQFGGDKRDVSNVKAFLTSPNRSRTDAPIYNHDNFQYAFLNGHRDQPWLGTFRGIGSSSIVHNAGTEVTQTDLSSITGSQSNVVSGGYTTASGNATASPITISASTMGISNQPEIDRLKLNFKFSAMIASKKSSGDEAPAHVELRIFLGFKRAGDSSFTEVQVFGPTDAQIQARKSNHRTSNFNQRADVNNGFISAETKAPFVESLSIDMQEFQPFSDFQVKIERVNPVNARHGDYDHTNPCTLTSIEAIIEDRLSYPLSAYGAVIFDAQSFSSVPTRGYEIKGLKVQVPTNYFPKGEGGRTVGEYDRNVTTGADSGGNIRWDGNFRGDTEQFTDPDNVNYHKVWTDNPAWVFYDLVTNNRYGVGKYISKDQVDKFELFKIARYCDELVDDGKGGTEPRFTCNLYLQEKAEALKVLKDVTSVFRGMLYWLDGEIQFSQNRYQNPIYNFSKSNVIGGLFKYTSSKQQYRSNQIRVTWNDPEAMFKKAVEIVEDTNNILETGRIVSKDVVAFGCTSRGQAHRFGKWTILTEILETEAVSFSTSINAGFLKPGDVVLIQDADVDNIRYSGRIDSGSTTTSIKIDSAVNLGSTNTNKISIVYPNGGAYLAQESATINSVAYKRGDLITQALIEGTLTTLETSDQAYNAEDDSGNYVELNWSHNSRVETQTISSTGNSATLTTAAFSSAPPADAAWAIREVNSAGILQDGSALQYVITSINETEPTVYEIEAIKYDPSKFDLVDRGYVLDVGIDTNKPPSYQDEVPIPKSLSLSLKRSINANPEDDTKITGGTGNVLHIAWQHPTSIRSGISSKYEHLSHYEIRHNVDSGGGLFKSIRVGKDDNSIDIPVNNLAPVIVQIRTVSTAGTKSAVVQKKFNMTNQIAGVNTLSRIGLLPIGGQFSTTLSLNTITGLASLGSSTYTFIAANGEPFSFNSTGTGNTEQSFDPGGGNVPSFTEAYLIFDASDTSDHLKAVEVKTDTTATDAAGNVFNFEYLAEIGASNAGLTNTQTLGTVAAEETVITGTVPDESLLPSFDTDFSVGDRIVLEGNGGTTRFFATVTHIESSSELEIDNPVPRAYSATTIKKLSFAPNLTKDTIVAKIGFQASSATYSLENVFAITSGGAGTDGKRMLTHFVYFQSSSSSAPATPSATNYRFSTNTFTGLTSGWGTTPPTFAAGNLNKYWYSYFTAEENTAGGDLASGGNLVFQSSVQGIGFSGLVTFSGTDLVQEGTSTAYNPATVINAGTTTIDGGRITTNTIEANRIKLSGSGALTIGSLTNDSNFITSSGAPVQSVAGATGAVSASTIISAGNIIVSGDNISSLTNNSGFITGGQVNSNVTSISGGVITTGTLNGNNVNVTNLNASNISSGTLNSARINTNTLNVKFFDNVTSQIINHNSNAVPLTRFGNTYTTTASSGGEGQGVSTHVPVTITNCRSGGSFVAFLTGILGDVQNAEVEFSVNGGSSFSTCANGVQFSINAGTFRPYTLIYSDTLTFSGSNQTAIFRVRFNGKKNYTQLGLTVLVDNTN